MVVVAGGGGWWGGEDEGLRQRSGGLSLPTGGSESPAMGDTASGADGEDVGDGVCVGFEGLPVDVLVVVISSLHCRDVMALAQVCRAARAAAMASLQPRRGEKHAAGGGRGGQEEGGEGAWGRPPEGAGWSEAKNLMSMPCMPTTTKWPS